MAERGQAREEKAKAVVRESRASGVSRKCQAETKSARIGTAADAQITMARVQKACIYATALCPEAIRAIAPKGFPGAGARDNTRWMVIPPSPGPL